MSAHSLPASVKLHYPRCREGRWGPARGGGTIAMGSSSQKEQWVEVQTAHRMLWIQVG